MVDGFDVNSSLGVLAGVIEGWINKNITEKRIVDLKQKTRLDDG